MQFNINPYNDDFAQNALDNNYMRIMFKPGKAVQTRELTQIQSILQNQIKQFGDHVFQDGSPVIGGNLTLDNKKAYVSVLIKAVSTPPIAPGIRTDVTGCIEKIIVISPGYGYTTGDKITDGKNTYTPIVSPNSGAIVDVTPLNNPICGFEEPPDLTINTNTGIGAAFVPLMKYYPTYISINKPYDLIDQKRISTVGIKTVIDCV